MSLVQLLETTIVEIDSKVHTKVQKEKGKGKKGSYRSASPRINVRDVMFDIVNSDMYEEEFA